MTIVVTDPAGGETITAGPITIRILEDGTNTAGRLGLVELTIPPHTDGPPQHVHREHDETFYAIAGVTSFTTGTDTVLALPGTLVTAPPGTPHTFGNPTDEPAILLCTVTPRHYIDYFRALATLHRGPDGLDPRDVAELMTHYATDVVHQDRPQ
jgi:quercetin dioxygenase-like cupin family protein